MMGYRRKSFHVPAVGEPFHYFVKRQRIQQHIHLASHQGPEVYEDFLIYYTKSRQANPTQTARVRRLLSTLNVYLESLEVNFSNLKICYIDGFLMELRARIAPSTYRCDLYSLRHFLKYLYHECGILKRDLSPLLEPGPPRVQVKPPKFFRHYEIKRLFANIDLSSKRDLRTYAILHLAYTLGLTPKEICMLSLDDINFRQGEINLPFRRNIKSFSLPLSDNTIKAIASYVVGARPQSNERALFLNLKAPHKPVSSSCVGNDLSRIMRKANLESSAYWLRHTYAHNLMELGASFFEIKEILGHKKIQTAKRYIQINVKLMRQKLFNETL